MHYTEAEKFEIFSLYVKNNKNKKAARREYMRLHPNNTIPSANTFVNIYNRVRDLKSFKRKRRCIPSNENQELDILLYFEGSVTLIVCCSMLTFYSKQPHKL